jgi:TetR/AcrR family transcriptional repressor of nem operon
MDKNDVKLNLIEVGAKAIMEKGYHAVGLQEILAEARVPKGSFYYYFKSKEDFCIAIIAHYIQRYAERHLYILLDHNIPAKERLLTFFSREREYFLEEQCQQSCLLAKLTMEMSRLSQPIRSELERGIDGWVLVVASCLKEGVESGEFELFQSPEVMAEFVYASWIGAITRMQVSQSIKPLDIFIEYLTREIGSPK